MQIQEQMRDDFRKLRPVGFCFLVVFLAAGVPSLFYPSFLERQHLELGLLVGVLLGPFLGSMTSQWKNTKEQDIPEAASELYLEGKMKRYSLLFSVNGGAFAIIQFSKDTQLPGVLSMFGLSFGLILFTLLMVSDIWLWGADMRQKHGIKLFRPVGQMILLMIGALFVSGWLLMGVLPG